MKWISFSLLAAMALAILALSISAPMLSSGAYANKMNGKGSGCSDGVCMGINSPKYGQKVACPVRTCSMAGTAYARDIRNCSAANCRK
jgi:hypothetical protein